MKKFFIFAAALCASATPAMADEMSVRAEASDSPTFVQITATMPADIVRVRVYARDGVSQNHRRTVEISPTSGGEIVQTVVHAECGRELTYRVVAWDSDGKMIKSPYGHFAPSDCESDRKMSRYEWQRMQDDEEDFRREVAQSE